MGRSVAMNCGFKDTAHGLMEFDGEVEFEGIVSVGASEEVVDTAAQGRLGT